MSKPDEDELNYELVKRERSKSESVIKSLLQALLSNIGLVAVCIVIAVLGAEAYVELERPAEEKDYEDKKKAGKRVDDAQKYLADHFYDFATDKDKYNFTEDDFGVTVDRDLWTFIEFTLNATVDYSYDGEIEGWEYSWTFPNALLFTVSIMTMVGYGHIAPQTLSGKVFTIFYSLIALGVFLVMVAIISGALSDGLIFVYSRVCCRWFRSRRTKSEIPSRPMRKLMRRRLIDEEVGDEPYMPTNTIAIPILISVVVATSYIVLGSVMYSQWEGWTVMTAAYFSMITLTTIGFGDYSPTKSFTDAIAADATAADLFKLIIGTAYLSIGLALIAMCISLIQEQAARTANSAVGKKSEAIELDQIQIVARNSNWNQEDAPLLAPVDSPEDVEAGVLPGAVSNDEEDSSGGSEEDEDESGGEGEEVESNESDDGEESADGEEDSNEDSDDQDDDD